MNRIPIILLVEDNPDDELLTRRAILSSGIAVEVFTANDGPQALNLLLGTYNPPVAPELEPDMVFLDLKLPRLNGLEVLNTLRQRQSTGTLPIIILTSSAEKSDIQTAYELGCNSYIQKPVDFEQFSHAIHAACRYWLQVNHQIRPDKEISA